MRICQPRTTAVLGLFALSCALLFTARSLLTAQQGKESPSQAKQGKADQQTVRDLIKKLGDDSFDTREDAEKQLVAIGEPALELLRQIAKETSDPEVRQRAEQLVRMIASSQVRQVRMFAWPTKVQQIFGISRVVVTPDGKKILAGTADGLRSFELESGKELLTFGEHKSAIMVLTLSPDGRQALAAGSDRVVRLYDPETGKKRQQFQGHTGEVWGGVFLPDGKQVLTGGYDQTLRVWDMETGQQVRQFEGVRDKVRCLCLSPDGKTVAGGHFTKQQGPGTVRMWDIESGKEIRAFEGHAEEIPCVAFSPDGKLLASSGFDKTLRIWDVAGGKELHRLKGNPNQYVEWAEFTPDSKRIVSCGTAGQGSTSFATRTWTVRVWDVVSGQQVLESEEIKGGALCVAVLPDGHRCVTASRDAIVRLWEWKK